MLVLCAHSPGRVVVQLYTAAVPRSIRACNLESAPVLIEDVLNSIGLQEKIEEEVQRLRKSIALVQKEHPQMLAATPTTTAGNTPTEYMCSDGNVFHAVKTPLHNTKPGPAVQGTEAVQTEENTPAPAELDECD